jgi:hypothetical protein
MITGIGSYVRCFDSIRRRTERDIEALPSNAAAWRTPAVHGETGWSIGDIVGHIGSARLYFASAYRGEGWISVPPELDSKARHADAVQVVADATSDAHEPTRLCGR